ncbi:MAG: ParB N-terminal domain-containing protein, partial [Kiritimatiellae bacterium]|nr:ParB N-terminal domain-containing protein [Kiritimatiellia bacterium]
MKPKVIEAKIADLKPYSNNPRLNDDAVPAIIESINEFGFIGAIVINRENVIINGHTRVKAMTQMGKTTIPAIVVDYLTKEQEDALRIADNRTGEVAKWDMELLK